VVGVLAQYGCHDCRIIQVDAAHWWWWWWWLRRFPVLSRKAQYKCNESLLLSEDYSVYRKEKDVGYTWIQLPSSSLQGSAHAGDH